MKAIRKIIIIYSTFMLAALGVMILLWKNMKEVTNSVASYNEEELALYKKIWNNLNANLEQGRDMMLKYVITFWAVLLVIGIIFILVIHHFMIKPVKEMENFASEIAKGNLDVPLPIHRNNMFGSFTESFDIMREELKVSKEREFEAEKAKREMVAELSHDLKTPVATIRATCEVLDLKYKKEIEKIEVFLKEQGNTRNGLQGTAKEVPVSGSQPGDVTKPDDVTKDKDFEDRLANLKGNLEKIGYIYKKADTINELVGSVFRATLDDMQEIKIEPKENDSLIIESYFASLKEYGNIILDNHIPECLLIFDKLRMEQVIDNIVGNSYKYAGTDIHVSFAETEMLSTAKGSKNTFIKITIRDSGPGVPEEDLPLLTEKFHRGGNAGDKQGYGLGMYLANHYMEKQGGGMEYYNDHGFVVEILVRKV
ncbi:MAG: HAMP domain-containing histidine kinase [Lachnospiraceae bacterium]|nr:HAMP domain-containing histidine kinase [Lachnospiraceae bacterium]